MAEFPALEVMTAGGHDLPLGTRLPLTRVPFVLGRAKDNALPVRSGLVSRRHCEVVFEYDRWWVRDLGASNGTWHLGERVQDAELLHGDCFELPWGVVFRLLLREPEDLRDAAMERAIAERPDDDERWSVYADWLQERGAPLGERIANPLPSSDRRWLGPLAGFAGRGELQVDWAHGLPARVVLRCLTTWRAEADWERRVATLLRQPEFRFLRSLELDVGSFVRASPVSRWGARLLELLGPDGLPMLERLAIGPGAPPGDVQLLDAPLAARRAKCPCFATTAATLFLPWKRATLTHGAQVWPLPGRTFHVGPPLTDLVLGPDSPALGLLFFQDRWLLTVDRAARGEVRINGLPCKSALLRPGDVIEPMPGVRLVFSA